VAGQRQILPPVLTTAAPATAAQTWRIDPPMARTAEWQSAFGEKVGSMVALKLDSASIRVSPENLGPLDISIRFDSQDQAAISVVAANPEAKAIVESSLPQLARMLENSGIQLGSTQVSTQHQQQAQQQAQEHAQQQAGRQGRQPGHAAGQEAALPEPEPALSAVSTRQNGLSIHA
jgi:flagellar hook-length control protein FliK